MNNLYETLGVNKDATAEDIKKNYRKLAVENHPDKGGENEKMKEITAAYNILKDPTKRERYDKTGETDSEQSFESRFRNMLANVFSAIVDTHDDVERTDLVNVFIGELRGQEERQRADLIKMRSEIEKLEKVIKRVKGDGELITSLIESKIEQVKRAIAMTEGNIEFITESILRCKDFNYEVDVQPEPDFSSTNDMIEHMRYYHKIFTQKQ